MLPQLNWTTLFVVSCEYLLGGFFNRKLQCLLTAEATAPPLRARGHPLDPAAMLQRPPPRTLVRCAPTGHNRTYRTPKGRLYFLAARLRLSERADPKRRDMTAQTTDEEAHGLGPRFEVGEWFVLGLVLVIALAFRIHHLPEWFSYDESQAPRYYKQPFRVR